MSYLPSIKISISSVMGFVIIFTYQLFMHASGQVTKTPNDCTFEVGKLTKTINNAIISFPSPTPSHLPPSILKLSTEQHLDSKQIGIRNQPDSFENSAGLVKDLYTDLPFPQILFASVRPINHTEVQQYVSMFEAYAEATRKVAAKLVSDEAAVLFNSAKYYQLHISSFAANYSSFERTSVVLSHLKNLSNKIKGRAFESLVHIILLRKHYSVIASGISSQKMFKRIFELEIYKRENVEIDIVAVKDGITYLIETKSFKPIDNEYLQQEIESTSLQIQARRSLLQRVKKVDSIRLMVIAHFNLGEEVRKTWVDSGADAIHFVRKNFLDDFNSY